MAFEGEPLESLLLSLLLTFHPSWMTKTVTSHDFWGGNGDGQYFGGETLQYEGEEFKVLFHEKGEGSIERFLISALPEERARDYLRLVIIIDGQEIYDGGLIDFFQGKGPWSYPLVYDITQSSGSFVSYVPFPYLNEAMILMRTDPHFYQVTYREGTRASQGPSPEEIKALMEKMWWHGDPGHSTLPLKANVPMELASGPALITNLKLQLHSPEHLKSLQIKVGNQTAIPLAFFFGLGVTGSEFDSGLKSSLASSLTHVDATKLEFASRLPIPLQKGQSLSLISTSNLELNVNLVATTAPPGVRLAAQYRDQWAAGQETTMTLFENHKPTQLFATTMQITDGKPGDQLFLEGEEIIRVDGLEAPVELGTGTEEYFGAGWYFWSVFSNFFSGLPRRVPEVLSGEDWKKTVFEHSLYRQHFLNPIIARRGIHFGFEAGDHGAYTPVRYRTLVMGYEYDTLKVQDVQSLTVPATTRILTWVDGERSQNERAKFLDYRFIEKGNFSLSFKCPRSATGLLLERTFDGGRLNQSARVSLKGRQVAVFFNGYANTARRFAQEQVWVDLEPVDCASNQLNFNFEVENWTDSSYRATFY
jgi:hypothetical protein